MNNGNAENEDGGGAAAMQQEHREMESRQRSSRLFMFIMLMYLMMHTSPVQAPRSSKPTTPGIRYDAFPDSFATDINSFLNKDSFFPQGNITGVFQGGVKTSEGHESPLTIQLKSTPITNALNQDFEFIYGIARVTGVTSTSTYFMKPTKRSTAVYMLFQGVYIPSSRAVTLLSTPYHYQQLVLQTRRRTKTKEITGAANSAKAVNTSKTKNASNPQELRTLLQDRNAVEEDLLPPYHTNYLENEADVKDSSVLGVLEPLSYLSAYMSHGVKYIRNCIGITVDQEDDEMFNLFNSMDIDTISLSLEEENDGWHYERNLVEAKNESEKVVFPLNGIVGGSSGELGEGAYLYLHDLRQTATSYKPSSIGDDDAAVFSTPPIIGAGDGKAKERTVVTPSKSMNATPGATASTTIRYRNLYFGGNLVSENFRILQKQLFPESSKKSPPSTCGYVYSLEADSRYGNVKLGDLSSSQSHRGKPVKDIGGNLSTYGDCEADNRQSWTVFGYSQTLETEDIVRRAGVYSSLYIIISLFEILISLKQHQHMSTSTLCTKVSIVSISMQILTDSLVCVLHLVVAMAQPELFFTFASIATIKLFAFTLLQTQAIIKIAVARYAQTAGWSLQQQIRTMHVRAYIAFLLSFGLLYLLQGLPVLIVLLLYSAYVPQIVQNVLHATRKGVLPLYYVGMGFLRIFFPLYVYGCPGNIFIRIIFADNEGGSTRLSGAACIVLVVWTVVQVGILYLQDVFKPRFFVPKMLLPVKYNYFRPIPAQFNRFVEDEHREGDGGGDIEMGDMGGSRECVICYNTLDMSSSSDPSAESASTGSSSFSLLQFVRNALPSFLSANTNGDYSALRPQIDQSGSEENNSQSLPAAQRYMITPCNHIFHQECLTQWLNVKLECPVCRHELPPVDDDDDETDNVENTATTAIPADL